MTTTALSHSTAPTIPPISTASVGRFSVDFGTLYKLAAIVSGVAIAVFAILEELYLVAACALTLSAFAIYSWLNREPVPQNPPQLPAVTSTQQPPSLRNSLDASASSTVGSSENDDSEYFSLDEDVELGSLRPQCVQQAANPLIGAHPTEQIPLVRQATDTASLYQATTARSLSRTPSDDESRSKEGDENSKNDEAIPLNFSSVKGSDNNENPTRTAASRQLDNLHEAKNLSETLKAALPSRVQYRDDKDPVELGTYIFDHLLEQGRGGVQLDPETGIYTVTFSEAKRVPITFNEDTAKKLNGRVVEPVLCHTEAVQFKLREGGMELFGNSLTVSAKIKVGILGKIGVDATVKGVTGEAPHPFAETHMLGAIRLNEGTNSVVRGIINNVICPLMNTDLSRIKVRREPAVRLLYNILHTTN